MKTLKITTCQTFTTRVLTGRKSVKTQMKKKQNLTWRESGHLFFVLHVCFFLQNGLCYYYFFLIQTLAYYGGIVSNFVCQLKKWLFAVDYHLLAMEPVAPTGLWIWYWVQCDFKGNPCRRFLLICHSRINWNTTVGAFRCGLVWLCIFSEKGTYKFGCDF